MNGNSKRVSLRPSSTTNGTSINRQPLSQAAKGARVASPMSFAALRSTTMLDTKPFLPAEIISLILDYLPIPDLIHFARTSRRMQEMVYEDTRWIQKLKMMGVWDEAQARARIEEAMKRKLEAQKEDAKTRPGSARLGSANGSMMNGGAALPMRNRQGSVTIFDQGWEEQKRLPAIQPIQPPGGSRLDDDGFTSAMLTSGPAPASTVHSLDPEAALTVFRRVRSVRGHARQEYGKIYAALAPFYYDLVKSRSHADPIVFRLYQDPEQQAQMLTQLRIFARADITEGWSQRENTLESMIGIFENAVLREFEQGYEANDVQGRMRKYAHVLVALNGGAAAIDLYIHNHRIFLEKDKLGNPLACLASPSPGQIDLMAVHNYFQRLSLAFNEESGRIEQIFPPTADVQLPLLDRANDEIISEYVTTLFDEAHQTTVESYLKIVAAVYQQCLQFAESLRPAAGSQSADFQKKVMEILNRSFEPHIDLFLQEELDFFRGRANAQVQTWEKKLSEQEASDETYFMSNINRAAQKRDFMASFKKVVMLPVNAVQTIPFAGGAKPVPAAPSVESSRPTTPMPNDGHFPTDSYITSRPIRTEAAPTTELAAKAALMNSKLEGINTLFSLEVALSLVHAAKASIERAAPFTHLGSQSGEEAKEQCQAIFVELLQVLGFRHIKPGFDKAVGHLSSYNPREVSHHTDPTTSTTGSGVKPLVTFLELVNVGDLIQQMVDVFYATELVQPRLSDRDDFLDPAVKEKKRFEQMLDERVAAGLNKGIDVLMDEVEFVCATTQSPIDFNPQTTADIEKVYMDIGPTSTATAVVNLVSQHTSMLTGSADKTMLDVFNQEVGLRLFTALTKHIKRQRISTTGAIKLIADTNHYATYIAMLRNKELAAYFKALREVSQIFLIQGRDAKEIATIVADADRYGGVFRAEEVLEFAERRADWFVVRGDVEKAMYGMNCVIM